MRKEIEIQQENIQTLIKLATENPELKIVPMINSEIVADEGYCYWAGSWDIAYIDEVYVSDERIYFKSNDFEELVEEYIDDTFTTPIDSEIEEKEAEEYVNNLPWEKVIVVYINTPR